MKPTYVGRLAMTVLAVCLFLPTASAQVNLGTIMGYPYTRPRRMRRDGFSRRLMRESRL